MTIRHARDRYYKIITLYLEQLAISIRRQVRFRRIFSLADLRYRLRAVSFDPSRIKGKAVAKGINLPKVYFTNKVLLTCRADLRFKHPVIDAYEIDELLARRRAMRQLIRWLERYLNKYYNNACLRNATALFRFFQTNFQLRRGLLRGCYRHGFHLVTASPWPIFISISLFSVVLSLALFFHKYSSSEVILGFGLVNLLVLMGFWFRDIIVESTFEGNHTRLVQRGLKIGMLLFILSEVMFFVSFFWGFFHSSLAPAIQIGGIWPPAGIEVFDPWAVPFLNTVVLLTSGVTVTWAHFAIRSNFRRRMPMSVYTLKQYARLVITYFLVPPWTLIHHRFVDRYGHMPFDRVSDLMPTTLPPGVVAIVTYWPNPPIVETLETIAQLDYCRAVLRIRWLLPVIYRRYLAYPIRLVQSPRMYRAKSIRCSRFPTMRQTSIVALGVTIIFGMMFTMLQFYEYLHAPFNISDSVYGSTFFLTTGFHGLHVIIGTLFLSVCFYRLLQYHFTFTHHVGFECAIWYWHFVDVVWLGLYLSIYHWGS